MLTVVEPEYEGPKLDEEGKVSLSFVKQLVETFKKQQKLHRRYAYKVQLQFEMMMTLVMMMMTVMMMMRRRSKKMGASMFQYR